MILRSSRRANFDRIARAYRWLEYLSLGTALEKVRLHHLRSLTALPLAGKRALILGDGDGRFTARLLRAQPLLRVDVVDSSAAMLALLWRRCHQAGGGEQSLEVHHTDALAFVAASPRTHSLDLVVSHFFLDCLHQDEVERLIDTLSPTFSPRAVWLVSEFRIPAGLLHWPARLYVRALYFAFRVLTGLDVHRLPNYAEPLGRAGFRPVSVHRALLGLLTTELWQCDRAAEQRTQEIPPLPAATP